MATAVPEYHNHHKNVLRVGNRCFKQNYFFSQFQITAIIFFLCLATAASNFLFLLNFYKRCLKECSPCADECWAMCVYVFYRRSFSEPKMFLTACVQCSYKGGGNKNEVSLSALVLFFRRFLTISSYFTFEKVIKLLNTLCFKNTLRQVDLEMWTKLDVSANFSTRGW